MSQSNHRPESPRKLHRDWRVWVGVILMLLAMLMYLVTLDDSVVPVAEPAPAPGASVP